MESTELRKALEEYLDLLKRNLAVASLETLKTKYKKPFDELRHNISSTATAYVKQIAFENIRIRADFMDEAQPLIQSTVDQSGILKQISSAAFKRQDIAEIDQLALALKEHICLYLDDECFGNPPKAPKFYNVASGCMWKDDTWAPAEVEKGVILLPAQDMPKTAA